MAITGSAAVDHFDALEFDQLLTDHGTPALWQKARQCPCLDESTGQASITCPFCRDFPGTVWDAGVPLIVLAPGRVRRDEYDAIGGYIAGAVTVTFPHTVTPGHLDRITLTAGVMVVNNERHVRAEVDPLGRSTERVRIMPMLGIEFCDAIIGGQQFLYVEGVDLAVDANGGIVWYTDGPPVGSAYTMRYQTRPAYVCWSPQSRDENANKLPYRCVAQRLDFWRRPVVGE